jgi:hypothetical protein
MSRVQSRGTIQQEEADRAMSTSLKPSLRYRVRQTSEKKCGELWPLGSLSLGPTESVPLKAQDESKERRRGTEENYSHRPKPIED